MNSQSKPAAPGLTEGLVTAEQDYYTWTLQQANLLDSGRFSVADISAISEELRDLGRSQFEALESAIRIVLLHLLKWDYQPGMRTRSWQHSIAAQRLQIAKRLRRNPGLKSRLGEALTDAYADARLDAAIETGLAVEIFPSDSPYDFAEVMDRVIAHPNDIPAPDTPC
jgi:hypothetical protein